MKLPRRGLLTNEEGQVIWAWEHNDENTEFDSVPPFFVTMDGAASTRASPSGPIVDLDDQGLEPHDMGDLIRDIGAMRMRKRKDGSLRLTRVLTAEPSDGRQLAARWLFGRSAPPETLEVDHPLIDVINFRRAQKGQPPIKKGE